MAELDEPGDEPNFDLFGSFGLDLSSDDELLLTETDLTNKKKLQNKQKLDNSTMKTLTILLLKTEQNRSQLQFFL